MIIIGNGPGHIRSVTGAVRKNDYSVLSNVINTLNGHSKYPVSIYHFVCRSIMATGDATTAQTCYQIFM
jgi:hypothetical protein